MLDYSYWALCSAGIITIISYSTGREKYKTATAQESDQHRKEKEDKQANHTVYTQYQSWEACPKNESWDWYLRTTLESSSDGTSIICFGEFRPSSSSSSDPSSDWRHGLNLMANQLPKQSWLHDFAQNKSSYHSSREHSISRGLKVFSLCDAPFFTFFLFLSCVLNF